MIRVRALPRTRSGVCVAVAAAALVPVAAPAAAATVVQVPYGATRDGRPVSQTILRNDSGVEVRFISYGGIVTDIIVPDAAGRPANVVLGFANIADYEAKNGNYGFGAIIGRYAGRIAKARFSIDGREYRLQANDGPNTLHGGPGGLDKKHWTVAAFRKGQLVGATLSYLSPDDEQGFPGNLALRVTYSLTPDNSLRIDYEARTDKPTMLNLTNHSYFNLAGAGSGTMRNHLLKIGARRYVEIGPRGIPTGRFPPVVDTPFDFRSPAAIGKTMDRPHPQTEGHRGFNHGWLLDRGGAGLQLAARLTDPGSGRSMDVLTSEPSLHIYAANWFSGNDAGAQGVRYRPHHGIALETQHLPDSPNRPLFPSTLLRPGETFRSTTIFRFSAAPLSRSRR